MNSLLPMTTTSQGDSPDVLPVRFLHPYRGRRGFQPYGHSLYSSDQDHLYTKGGGEANLICKDIDGGIDV